MGLLGEHQSALFSYFVGLVILAPLLAAGIFRMAHSLEKRRERVRQRREQQYIDRLRLTLQ